MPQDYNYDEHGKFPIAIAYMSLSLYMTNICERSGQAFKCILSFLNQSNPLGKEVCKMSCQSALLHLADPEQRHSLHNTSA